MINFHLSLDRLTRVTGQRVEGEEAHEETPERRLCLDLDQTVRNALEGAVFTKGEAGKTTFQKAIQRGIATPCSKRGEAIVHSKVSLSHVAALSIIMDQYTLKV